MTEVCWMNLNFRIILYIEHVYLNFIHIIILFKLNNSLQPFQPVQTTSHWLSVLYEFDDSNAKFKWFRRNLWETIEDLMTFSCNRWLNIGFSNFLETSDGIFEHFCYSFQEMFNWDSFFLSWLWRKRSRMRCGLNLWNMWISKMFVKQMQLAINHWGIIGINWARANKAHGSCECTQSNDNSHDFVVVACFGFWNATNDFQNQIKSARECEKKYAGWERKKQFA